MKLKLFYIMLIVLVLFSISGVCAGDADNQTLQLTNDNTLLLNNSQEVISSNGAGTFDELQDLINNNDVVNLTKDYSCPATPKSIQISKNIVINGNGHYLDAGGQVGILVIKSGNVVLNNISIVNGHAEDGGAIRIESMNKLTLNHVTFSNNYASEYGGAIYSKSEGQTIDIINCTFAGNDASYNGAGETYACGGAIYTKGSVNVIDSNFIENRAFSRGGAIFAEGSVNVIDSNFTRNRCTVDGGAIYSENRVSVKKSVFDSNRAFDAAAQCWGGAICSESLYAEDSSFTKNEAENCGGAIYVKSSNQRLDIINCNFVENSARGSSVAEGGAIYANCPMNVENSIFSHNTAFKSGGAIYSKNDVSVKKSVFESNTATGKRGGAIYCDDDVSIYNSTFRTNSASDEGGAIYSDTITWIASYSFFYGNQVSFGDGGGAIYTNKFTNNVEYGIFTKNKAYHEDGSGGAIYINSESDMTFLHCKFENNFAEKEGGAIFFDSKYSDVTLINNSFVNNVAKEIGQDVSNDGNYVNIENNWWGTSSPDFTKGLIVEFRGLSQYYNHKDKNPLKEAPDYDNVYSNLISDIGSGGNITLANFITCYRYNYGGTINITKSGTIDGNGVIIDMAGSNIQVFNITASNVTIKNLIIKNANFQGNGSVICFNGISATVYDCIFVNNTAGVSGGVIYLVSDSATVYDCTFVNNTAGVSGGAIYFDGGSITVEKSIFHNTAVNGNDIYFKNPVNSNVSYSSFSNQANVITTTNSININDNWWGVNNPEWNTLISGTEKPSAFAVLNVTADKLNLTTDSKSKSILNYILYWNGTDDVANIPAINIELSSNGGVLKDKSGYLINGKFSTEFRSSTAGVYVITAKVGNQEVNITINVNGGSYSHLIEEIGEGKNITLQYLFYGYDYGGTINITKSCTIDGNGSVIDMINSNIQVFKITANNVIIKNLIIKNVNSRANGGAIYLNANSVTLQNCTFINNVASNGGAIYSDGVGTVVNCTFENNHANNGGAIYYKGAGTVVNCTFENNSATNGGAIYLNSQRQTIDIINCTFINNVAKYGGAIYSDGVGTLVNCTFENNHANNGGGAIYAKGSVNIEDSFFSKNTSPAAGGAIYLGANSFLNNCTFVNNNATGSQAGAACLGNNCTLSYCSFIKNTAKDAAGAIYFNGIGTVVNCTFENNKAARLGGAVYFEGNGDVSNCSFVNNSINMGAGAIRFSQNAKVSNCSFVGNIVFNGGGGAIIFNRGCNMFNCSFVNNKASKNGGAIYFDGVSGSTENGIIDNCYFVNNSADASGGAVYFEPNHFNPVLAVVSNCNFMNNSANASGGAVNMVKGEVRKCSFENNTAYVSGGAIYINNAESSVSICSFVNNTAFDGDAIFSAKSFTPNDDWWGSNEPNWNNLIGGSCQIPSHYAIFNVKADPWVINSTSKSEIKCTFFDRETGNILNISTRAIKLSSTGGELENESGYLINGYFSTAFSSIYDGYYVITAKVDNQEENDTVAVDGGRFSILRTEISSGGEYITLKYPNYIYDYGPTIEISESCTIDGNGAEIDMMKSKNMIQVFNITASNVTIKNLIIKNVNCSSGAIYINSWSSVNIVNCTFINNTAKGNGGAIFFEGISNVINCTFINNSASNGGAIYYNSWSPANIVNCTFINNSASNGSAIYLEGSTNGIISNSTFLNNSADSKQIIIMEGNNQIKIVFKGNNNLLNAIYSNYDIIFTNVTYWGVNGINNTGNTSVIPVRSENEAGQSIITYLWVDGEEIIYYRIDVTDINGTIILDYPEGIQGNYTILAYHEGDSYYSEIYNYTSNATKGDVAIIIDDSSIMEGQNATLTVNIVPNNATGNVTIVNVSGKNITVEVTNGTADFILPVLPVGKYTFNVIYSGDAKFNNATSTVNVTVNPKKVFTIDANDLTTTYNSGESLIATIKDGDTPVEGIPVAININGEVKDNLTTDSNGQINIQLTNWAASNTAYTVKLTINTEYYKGNKTVKVTIDKATPVIIVRDIALLYNETQNIDAHSYDGIVLNYGNIVNATVIEINGDTVKGLMNGTASFTVSVNETENYTANSVVVNVTVSPADLELNIDPSYVTILIDDVYDVSKNVTVDPVVDLGYVLNSTNIINITASGVVTALNAGMVNVTVVAGDDIYYVKKSVNMIITVEKLTPTITVSDIDLLYNQTKDINVSSYDGAIYLYDDIVNETVIEIEDNSKIKGLMKGTACFTIYVVENSKYKSASVVVNVTVSPADLELNVNPSYVTILIDDVYDVSKNVTVDPVVDLGYVLNSTDIINITASGVVTALNAGMVNVTVVAGDDIHYVKKSVNMTITVNLIPTEIIGDDTITVEIDNYIKPDISINSTKGPVSGNISFIISDPSIVEYDAVQGFKGLKTGNTTVNASYSGDDKYAASYKIINIEVTIINTNLTVEPDSLDLSVGDNAKINATVVPGGAGSARFKSNNESVVSVDVDGNVVAVGFGNTTITVSAGDGINYTVVSVDVPVNVKKIVTNLTVEPDSLDLSVGDNAKINATVVPGGAGSARFKSNNESVVSVDVDGNVVAVGFGNTTITVSAGDGINYTVVSVDVPVNVKKIVTMNIVAPPITVGSDAVVTVSLTPSDATGNISVGDKTVKIDNGVANITISNLTAGNHTLHVIYSGDDKFSPAESSVTIIVDKITPTINVNDIELLYDETKEINASSYEGAVLIYGGIVNATVIEISGDKIKGLMKGTASFTVSVNETDKYKSASVVVNVTVSPANLELNVNPSEISILVGDVYDVSKNVTVEPVVDLSYVLNSTDIINITASGVVTALKEGMVNVTVVAGDDIHYIKKSVNMTITVNLIPTEIIGDDTITVEIDNYIKPDISINSTKGPVSGNISFNISDPSIVEYDAVQGFKGLKTGNTTVNASYSGDDKYAASYKIINIEVTIINTNLTVEPDSLDLTIDDNAKINATVAPGGAGSARFKSNNESVVTVDVDGNVVAVGFGNTTITVSAGDGINYTVVSVDVPVNVKKIVPNLTVEPDSLDLTVGDNAKINATLIPSDAGTISFKSSDDNIVTVDNDGKVNATGKGNATITISFAGNDKYTPVNATVTINVKDKPVPKENVTMNIVAPPITVGSDAVVTVILTPSNATGNVSVGDKTVKIDSGVAKVVISNLGVGNHTLPVIYSGDGNFNPAESSVTITVNPKSKENVTMIIDAPEITEGQNATLNVTLPADATGTVTASIGAKKYTAKLVNGTATITIPDLTAGKYTIPVNYSGDDKYNPADQSVNLTVKDAKSDIITAPDVTKYFGGPERFIVSVTDYKGNPLANKSVTISINGASYTRITDVNGSASIPLGLNSGVYNVLSTLDNQSIESVVTILSTVNGTDVVKMYRNATQYHATFLDTNGKYLTDGTVVTFNINGIMYERKISGGKGQSGLNINLPQGEYIITAINPVNGEMATNNITVLPTLVDNKDIIKYYKNGTQYSVKVLDATGKAVGAGENVTFNINGIFYTRQTDASGIAKLTINLPPSNYIITAEYKGCSVANNITVLPVLNATDITMKYLDGTQFKANLVDGQGRPYAGQSVTFNINGVFYNRVTDGSGQAKLNIRLLPGEYIITSSYNGSNIANKITITA